MKKINEIFYSLQGEGFHTGIPAVFVRFSGCNLSCAFCDTAHEEGVMMSDEQIAEAVASYPARMVVLTGGEPSLWIDESLLSLLRQAGKYICIETNGTRALPAGIDWITLSPKTPTVALDHADELKIVFTGEAVEPWLAFDATHRYLQPCSCRNTAEVVQYILNHPVWSLSLQTHKYIDIP